MALALLIVFRSRMRLLPLGVALIGVALTFGAMSLFGVPLTIAAIAVLPVLDRAGRRLCDPVPGALQRAGG